MEWEMVRDSRTGRLHRYDPHCECESCQRICWEKETYRHTKAGGRRSYRGGDHTKEAGRAVRDGNRVKENTSKPNMVQRKKEIRAEMDD